MCLLRTEPKKIAEEDVVCYKFLERSRYFGIFGTKLKSPYRGVKYTLGKMKKSKLITEKIFLFHAPIVNIGLHSFVDYDDVVEFIESSDYVVVKCIIPKGAEYILGLFDGFPSYASDKLLPVEII